jgi:hypothetical protein
MSDLAICTASTLNVQAQPSTNAALLGQLVRGDVCELLASAGAWYRVRKDSLEGFAHGDFLRVLPAHPTPSYLRDEADLASVALTAPDARRATAPAAATSTQRALAKTWNDVGGLLALCCQRLGLAPAAALAVLQVESGGQGFDPGGRLIARFENHLFDNLWGQANADVYALHFRYDPHRRWQGHQFRVQADGAWSDVHASQDSEWQALGLARGFDDTAALRSASFGAPQILGRHHARLGYDSVQAMVAAFQADLRWHIVGLFDFVRADGLTSPGLDALRLNHFVDFAAVYNGTGNMQQYGARLAAAYEQALTVLPA